MREVYLDEDGAVRVWDGRPRNVTRCLCTYVTVYHEERRLGVIDCPVHASRYAARNDAYRYGDDSDGASHR